jgi:hypothetical protein
MGRHITLHPDGRGRRELQKLANDLEGLGRKLEPEIAKDLRTTVVPKMRAAIKQSAAVTLPRRGGLAARAAKSTRTTASGSTRQGVVKIRTASKKFDTASTDRGVVRHPVFGNREVSPRRAAAMPRRWPMPRENPPTRLVATPARPVISMTPLTREAFDVVGGGHGPQV